MPAGAVLLGLRLLRCARPEVFLPVPDLLSALVRRRDRGDGRSRRRRATAGVGAGVGSVVTATVGSVPKARNTAARPAEVVAAPGRRRQRLALDQHARGGARD